MCVISAKCVFYYKTNDDPKLLTAKQVPSQDMISSFVLKKDRGLVMTLTISSGKKIYQHGNCNQDGNNSYWDWKEILLYRHGTSIVNRTTNIE